MTTSVGNTFLNILKLDSKIFNSNTIFRDEDAISALYLCEKNDAAI